MSKTIEPFRLAVPQTALDDLRQRLALTRWPDRETEDGQGPTLAVMRALTEYWADGYDGADARRS